MKKSIIPCMLPEIPVEDHNALDFTEVPYDTLLGFQITAVAPPLGIDGIPEIYGYYPVLGEDRPYVFAVIHNYDGPDDALPWVLMRARADRLIEKL